MADPEVPRKVRDQDAENWRTLDPQQNGTMEFPRALDRRGPEHVKEVVEALALEGAGLDPTPGVAAKEETRVEDTEGSIDPELVFRVVAARLDYFLSQDRSDISPP